MGHYNPDWAIVFKDGAGVKHIYFVAETKGVNEDQLDVGVKGVEKAKIECAKKHFAKISNSDYIYISSYQIFSAGGYGKTVGLEHYSLV